ncbi:hypothetical protein EDD29_3927 [Actinocorallia herbida]|uniref:Uncharacterized protein n=1 Tax=Actinocorallia herbida TaxID=58109 RepID=A0A3N1CYK5_9ACTN|nr:hypothetical protein EDD29_3927 [Actinocorallia herbida]
MLAAVQVLSVLGGAVLGVFPAGWMLLTGVNVTLPVPWRLVGLIVAMVLVVAALTAVRSVPGGRRLLERVRRRGRPCRSGARAPLRAAGCRVVSRW